MKHDTLSVVLLLTGLGVILAGCGKGSTPASAASGPTSIILTLDWKPEPEFGGFYQAKLDGSFAKQNLEVTVQSAGSGAPTWQLVASKQTDYATTAADQVLIARARGADVVALFAVYQTFPQGIMVHQSRGFRSIADVFSTPGTLAAEDNAWLQFCLNKYAPVKVTVTGFSGGVSGFLANRDCSQQCFVTSEPILARRQGSDPQSFLIADSGFNPYTTVVITRGDRVRSNPAEVKAMWAACRAGWRTYLDHPETANAAMAKLNPDMDARTFADAAAAQKPLIETSATSSAGLGSMTAERWNQLAQQLVGMKVIATAPAADTCFVDAEALK